MYPADIKYTPSHEWARIEGDTATVGITSFAQEQLGDITFVDLPAVGAQVTQGSEFGSIESVKAASELYSPVTGEVVEVNEALEGAPELVNQDPFAGGWMIKVKLSAEPQGLLDAAAYEQTAVSCH
ncbi:Glycine cleavage system H protein [Fundidesulfovibrio magnetotacticus]|uniref:Glycine cleavage system H protein n=1 Tax=Fundidesulfovibrio magnetotacticus TaxID=2730080 RepID=A0A6V8LSZ0_9BACT|nr:glycine cleavage system protein GcvH [Fundidesulfovibrio magnetotacticus]GFK92737.1 Glycine cleavage system H protein [Fundidesulfovibrio magnetotacticus]